MTNLFQLLTEAKSRQPDWSPSELRHWMASIASARPEWRLDWEEGDEHWLRVLREANVVGYVSTELPIAFLHVAEAQKAIEAARNGLPIVHKVWDFDCPEFATSRLEMQEVFGRYLSNNVDYGNLSVNDLWWLTVH